VVRFEPAVETYEVLRRLAIRDDAFIQRVLAEAESAPALSRLNAKTVALARLASLVALDAGGPSYRSAVAEADAAGASDAELVACLACLMPAVGVPRVVSAAPRLALALGYDVGAALEELDPTGD
jgi:alkylhydroperoxidase/carboxymuconolactone decarboxylase family protein YurZ